MSVIYAHEIRTEVTSAPSLSLTESNDTFVAIMMDFSVNLTGSAASNMTLLHWVLPGLSSLNETMTLSSSQRVIAPYYPPGPPAGQTHTYGIFLYKQPTDFAIPTNYISFFNNLTASVVNRIGFNLTTFALEAGLGTPVAANWFLVSTPIITTSSIMASTLGSNSIIPTMTMSVTGTNTSMGSSFTASIGATATQSIISGAKKVGIESVAVAINTLWLVEIFL